MVDTDLTIKIVHAGDAEGLSKVLNAAMELAASNHPQQVKHVVPAGYRCVECYRDDGGHTPTCDIGAQVAARRAAE